ncbi:D-inositol-3-phosphate glycosyltransferase [subsurface metagenome]
MVHHGIDLSFYKANPEAKRGNRYLFLARFTPEKGFLEIAHLAKKCRVGLDAFGDTEIVSNQDYVRKCTEESDGRQIRVNPGISREETVKQYQSHKALITWPNYVEIFGLVTVEAMACGCPVISKDSGAAKELIKQGRTGFVVSTLEEAEELIKTDAVSKLKPENCVRQARRFSIERSAGRHPTLLQDVANGIYW